MITKLYEYISLWKLEVGDYVLVEIMYTHNPNVFKKGKIISLNKEHNVHFPIRIKTDDGIINTYQPSNIVRKLGKEEIKQFQMWEESEKYNL